MLQEAEELPRSALAENEEEEEGASDGEQPQGQQQRQRLPSWQSVALEGMPGVRPCQARAPRLPGAAPPADTACLQVEGGLCAAGDAGPRGGLVHLWGTEGDELRYQRALPGHDGGVTTLSFQRSTGWLAAGSGAGPVRLWDLER
jgi:hypothetical protein